MVLAGKNFQMEGFLWKAENVANLEPHFKKCFAPFSPKRNKWRP